MFKLVRRGIVANLGRLVLTLISVVLGVAFVSGSFILADSLRSVFNQISEDAFAGVDAQVRTVESDLELSSEALPRFDDAVVDDIRAVPGVNFATGGLFVQNKTFTLDAEGEINKQEQGPPVFTVSWSGPGPVSSFSLKDGQAPVGQQIGLDIAQATKGGWSVGDQVMVSVEGSEPEAFELAAIVEFGREGAGSGGASFLLFDLPTTQRILGVDGMIDSVVINAESGVGNESLLAAIEEVLPANLEVVSGETVIGEQKDQFGSFIDIFGNILLSFAVVVLFVSTFIIYNTFAILVGQRTRQLGLLRSIGAEGSQIRLMVLMEAVIIGIIASIIGLFGGLLVASGLKWLFSRDGGGFPEGPLQILPRTIIVVVLVGLIVTVVSALLPAIRASRVSPLEAVREGGKRERSITFRVVAGSIVLVPGLLLLALGMFGSIDATSSRLAAIGFGAAMTFVGVSMLSALFAGPVAAALGAPVELTMGVTGRLARDNASRNPQRTAATATALMIGLALITGVGVLTRSLLVTFDKLLEDALTADLFVYEQDQGLQFSGQLADELDALPETELVAGSTRMQVFIDDEVTDIAAFDTGTGTAVVNYGIVEGSATLSETGIAVFETTAEDNNLKLGQRVNIRFEDGFATDLTVESIFDDNSVLESSWLISRDLSAQHTTEDLVGFIGITFPEGADATTNRVAVEAITTTYPQLTVQDNSEFQEEVAGQIGQIQQVISGLLFLCIVVALVGIINTMTLSVLERTREIGLLRAVGMTRSQLRTTIRWEAVIVSFFGAVLGVGMGLLLGWAAVVAIPDSFISQVGIPWIQVVVYLVCGGLIGVFASYFPARRAAKMNVLDAISHE